MSVRLLSIIMLKVRPASFRYVTKSFWSKLNFSKYFLSFSRVWRCQRHNVIFFLSSNLYMQIIVKLIFRCIFPNFLVRRANYQLHSFNHIYICCCFFIFLSLNFYTSCEIIFALFHLSCHSNSQFLAQRMQQMTVLFRERRCKLWCGPTKNFIVLSRGNHNCKHSI